jgi:hypothetical protein
VTSRHIIRALDTKLGTLTLEGFAANALILEEAYKHTGDPSALTKYFANHAKAATVAASHGQDLKEVYKVTQLIRGLSVCGRYTDALTRFQDSEEDVADLTVANLQRTIERAEARMRLTTTADMRLSAAAAAATPAPALDYAALAAAIAPHLPGGGGDQRSAPPANSGPPIYCWTHGVAPHCSHHSHECRTPLPGHVAAATFTDRHNGWPHHKRHSKSRDRTSAKPKN